MNTIAPTTHSLHADGNHNISIYPSHPYTRGLLSSIPRPGRPEGERLVPIPGSVPPLNAMPPGCAFAPRCPYRIPPCDQPVELRALEDEHHAACLRAGEALAGA